MALPLVLRNFNIAAASWAIKWLCSTNHKRIAILYLVFGAFSGIIGTTLSVFIRMELAQPGNKVFLGNNQL